MCCSSHRLWHVALPGCQAARCRASPRSRGLHAQHAPAAAPSQPAWARVRVLQTLSAPPPSIQTTQHPMGGGPFLLTLSSPSHCPHDPEPLGTCPGVPGSPGCSSAVLTRGQPSAARGPHDERGALHSIWRTGGGEGRGPDRVPVPWSVRAMGYTRAHVTSLSHTCISISSSSAPWSYVSNL